MTITYRDEKSSLNEFTAEQVQEPEEQVNPQPLSGTVFRSDYVKSIINR